MSKQKVLTTPLERRMSKQKVLTTLLGRRMSKQKVLTPLSKQKVAWSPRAPQSQRSDHLS